MKKALAHTSVSQTAREPFTLRIRVASGLALLGLMAAVGLFASRPAHTAGGPVPVTVANTPLPTTAADNPAVQPFQQEISYYFDVGSRTAVLDSEGIIVPAGKRLVIQTVSEYSTSRASTGMKTFIHVKSRGVNGQYSLPPLQNIGQPYPGAVQTITLYADPASTVSFEVLRANPTDVEYAVFEVCGYYVNI